MELRHLRYFLAVAEDLHFAHVGEGLHIEQSPLYPAIKELECDLGAVIRTHYAQYKPDLGRQGLPENVRRIVATIDQAKASVKAAAKRIIPALCGLRFPTAVHTCCLAGTVPRGRAGGGKSCRTVMGSTLGVDLSHM